MGNLNTIFLGKDNPAVMTFSFSGDFAADGLNSFTNGVTVGIGGELYSTITTPDQLFIVGNNELRLKIGDTTSLIAGKYMLDIIGYSPDYDDGFVLNCATSSKIGRITVKDC